MPTSDNLNILFSSKQYYEILGKNRKSALTTVYRYQFTVIGNAVYVKH